MTPTPPYPIFLDLHQKPVLIVGGGNVALRKTRGLLPTNARISVVSPQFLPALLAIHEIEKIHARYNATHMSKKMWRLVFAATNDKPTNDLVQKHAHTLGILCCRCDDQDLGDFAGAATWTSPNQQVTLALGTTGASPVLAAKLRDAAAAALDPTLILLAQLLADWRSRIKADVPDPTLRREILAAIAGECMEATLRNAGQNAAVALFDLWLSHARAGQPLPPVPQPDSPSPSHSVDHAH